MTAVALEQVLPRVSGRHQNKVLANARKQRALELKLAGLTYQAITDEMGYADPSSAWVALRKAQQAGSTEVAGRTASRSSLAWMPCRPRCGTPP